MTGLALATHPLPCLTATALVVELRLLPYVAAFGLVPVVLAAAAVAPFASSSAPSTYRAWPPSWQVAPG